MVSFQNNLFGLENHRHILYNDIEIGTLLFDKTHYHVYILGAHFKYLKIDRQLIRGYVKEEYFKIIDLHVANYRLNEPFQLDERSVKYHKLKKNNIVG